MAKHLFTSESVTQGHPDKICDQVADAILDSILADDKNARVACEVFCTTGMVTVIGEITTDCYIDIPKIVREVIYDTGFNKPEYGFDSNSCAVMTSIDEQSSDIDMGVSKSLEKKSGEESFYNENGAGDQGMMFGFACNETPELMPLPISLAHKLTKQLAKVREDGTLSYLRPDGKSQVTVEYENDKPLRVDAVVISSQHNPDIDYDILSEDIIKYVIKPIIPLNLMDDKTRFFINPTGRFVIGGPAGDSGLTGRKIIVDTYGGYSRHGGGSFSGKDPTKVDRSATYAARYVAKNIVAAGLSDKCEVQLSYAIGVAHPISIMVDTFNTGKFSNSDIEKLVKEHFDLRPAAIIDKLELRKPQYKALSCYGHMGREDLGVAWEKTDMAETLKKAAEALHAKL